MTQYERNLIACESIADSASWMDIKAALPQIRRDYVFDFDQINRSQSPNVAFQDYRRTVHHMMVAHLMRERGFKMIGPRRDISQSNKSDMQRLRSLR